MITVSILAATICFQGHCYPSLIGENTPMCTFGLIQRVTKDPGYGGDVLQFYETDKVVYAIHRVWTLKPKQNRELRLKSHDPSERVITKGCINVDPVVYDTLKNCCIDQSLEIIK